MQNLVISFHFFAGFANNDVIWWMFGGVLGNQCSILGQSESFMLHLFSAITVQKREDFSKFFSFRFRFRRSKTFKIDRDFQYFTFFQAKKKYLI